MRKQMVSYICQTTVRIYFHYFKGWKERFLFRGNLLLPIFVRFYEKRNCLYTFWYYILFMYNRIKKIWIEEKEWYMRIILTTSYIATSFVIEWPLRFSIKWSYHCLAGNTDSLFNFILLNVTRRHGLKFDRLSHRKHRELIRRRKSALRSLFPPPSYTNRDVDVVSI